MRPLNSPVIRKDNREKNEEKYSFSSIPIQVDSSEHLSFFVEYVYSIWNPCVHPLVHTVCTVQRTWYNSTWVHIIQPPEGQR